MIVCRTTNEKECVLVRRDFDTGLIHMHGPVDLDNAFMPDSIIMTNEQARFLAERLLSLAKWRCKPTYTRLIDGKYEYGYIDVAEDRRKDKLRKIGEADTLEEAEKWRRENAQ